MPSFQDIELDAVGSVAGADGVWRSNDLTGVTAAIIFESDFSSDSGFSLTGTSTWDSTNKPTDFTSAQSVGLSVIHAVDNAGVGGAKPAMRLEYDPGEAQPVMGMMKHLTGDINTGFEEVYIRYRVKFPNAVRLGSGTTTNLWKWGRAWQNTAPVNPGGGNPGAWTENREDSFYIVWNFSGNEDFGIDQNLTVCANEGVNFSLGSAGGEGYKYDYYQGGGLDYATVRAHFENVGAGDWSINWAGGLEEFDDTTTQDWHTLEWRFKLASSDTANDGVIELWFDGVDQGQYTRAVEQFGAPAIPLGGMNLSKHGSGLNCLIFFDNTAVWMDQWNVAGVDGWLDVNDIVVSNARIGHTYNVGEA